MTFVFKDNNMIRSNKCDLEQFDKLLDLFENIAFKTLGIVEIRLENYQEVFEYTNKM